MDRLGLCGIATREKSVIYNNTSTTPTRMHLFLSEGVQTFLTLCWQIILAEIYLILYANCVAEAENWKLKLFLWWISYDVMWRIITRIYLINFMSGLLKSIKLNEKLPLCNTSNECKLAGIKEHQLIYRIRFIQYR